MKYRELNRVSRKEFYDFLEGKDLEKVQGEHFHSNYWETKDGEKVAYLETSSWGAPDLYMIKGGYPWENRECINIVSSLINKKS